MICLCQSPWGNHRGLNHDWRPLMTKEPKAPRSSMVFNHDSIHDDYRKVTDTTISLPLSGINLLKNANETIVSLTSHFYETFSVSTGQLKYVTGCHVRVDYSSITWMLICMHVVSCCILMDKHVVNITTTKKSVFNLLNSSVELFTPQTIQHSWKHTHSHTQQEHRFE